jgi:hypothetical protein
MTEETPFLDPLDAFLRDKAQGEATDSGNYRRNLERDVERFATWYRNEHVEEPTFEALDALDFRRYARDLRDGELWTIDTSRCQGDQPARGTVLTYYSNLSAYLGWCVDEQYLDRHLAQLERATDPLPEDDGRRSGDEQAWTATQRDRLLQHLRERAHSIVDDAAEGAIDRQALLQTRRDLALVNTLYYAGVRGAEVLRDPGDDRRAGLRWSDVSLADNRLSVLAKRYDTTWDDRSIADQAISDIERYRELLEPASGDWPVFVSFHRPSMYRALREAGLAAPADREADPIALCRDHDVVPPALSVGAARERLRMLTDAAGIAVDDSHGYLTLHGARRGAGEQMVRKKGFTAAARFLDDTERMVRERYSHINASELAKDVTEGLG